MRFRRQTVRYHAQRGACGVEEVFPTSNVTSDGDEVEYRVVRRLRGFPDAEWKLVITGRGLGRPFNSLAAARGLVTRQSNGYWNREYEYKIQWRPVTVEWRDV